MLLYTACVMYKSHYNTVDMVTNIISSGVWSLYKLMMTLLYHVVWCVLGTLIHERKVKYLPGCPNAVTVFPGGIITAENGCPPRVHIHTWSGEVVCALQQDSLELHENEHVHAVRMCGNTLIIAAGPVNGSVHTVRTLQAYKVNCSLSYLILTLFCPNMHIH